MSSPPKHRLKTQHWYRRFLRKRLPIAKWLPVYNSKKALADLIAGVTVGLTVIPQALAYATLAGLEPQVKETETVKKETEIIKTVLVLMLVVATALLQQNYDLFLKLLI